MAIHWIAVNMFDLKTENLTAMLEGKSAKFIQ